MNKWKMKLHEGIELRKLIENGEQVEVLKLLQKIVKKLMVCKEIDEYEREKSEEFSMLLEGDDELVVSNEEPQDFGFNNWEELVNERLEEFYNLCNDNRIWICI